MKSKKKVIFRKKKAEVVLPAKPKIKNTAGGRPTIEEQGLTREQDRFAKLIGGFKLSPNVAGKEVGFSKHQTKTYYKLDHVQERIDFYERTYELTSIPHFKMVMENLVKTIMSSISARMESDPALKLIDELRKRKAEDGKNALSDGLIKGVLDKHSMSNDNINDLLHKCLLILGHVEGDPKNPEDREVIEMRKRIIKETPEPTDDDPTPKNKGRTDDEFDILSDGADEDVFEQAEDDDSAECEIEEDELQEDAGADEEEGEPIAEEEG